MIIKTIPYQETGYFSKLICDYLAENPKLKPFYNRFPKLENFEKQLNEKALSVKEQSRMLLVKSLNKQNQEINISKLTQNNINALSNKNTFTITTGHQLNLFTGPLYFLYKIFSAINLSEKLNKEYPNNYFVPVYWMATEDHDFDEINYFKLFGKKIEWERESNGAVGELSTKGLEALLNKIKPNLGESENAKELSELFYEAYVKHNNLAAATRYLANKLFSSYGLVIIDGNDAELKKEFIPYAKKEFTENLAFRIINKTTNKLETLAYKKQVNPREINLFYLNKGLRERIIEDNGMFKINNTTLVFSKVEILKELQNYPERFSPNALLRPLFQEIILPNLCYIGGGGELAYWFQLKDYFKTVEVTFPILLLRNSVLLISEKQLKKLEKLNSTITTLFLPQYELEKEHTLKLSELVIDFSAQKKHLKKQFLNLYELAERTDKSFLGAVAAQEKKQLNGLDKLEKRLLKAEKRKLSDQLTRLTLLQDKLFPKESLQERTVNFSEFYLEHGKQLFYKLKESINPLCNEFMILKV